MTFHNIESLLNEDVESIFYYDQFCPDHSIERIIPMGAPFLIFEFDGFERSVFDNDTLEPLHRYRKQWFVPSLNNYITISAHKNSIMLVIQFRPYGALPYANIQSMDTLDDIVDLQGANSLFPNISKLRLAIESESLPDDKLKAVETWMLENRNSQKSAPAYLCKYIDHISPVESLKDNSNTEKYPMTRKQMIDAYRKWVGILPNQYKRILKFHKILEDIKYKKHLNWADIAAGFDYSDQSHFIREFKRFSGFKPGEYIINDFQMNEPNFYPLDRSD